MIKAFLNTIALTALLLLTGYAPSASAQQVDKTAWHDLMPPPRNTLMRSLSLNIGMGYSELQGYAFFWDGRKYSTDIARIQEQMRHAFPLRRALLYRQLGEFYQAQGDHDQAQQAWTTSVSLYSRLLDQTSVHRANGRFLAEYALALQLAGQSKEAERHVRSAVRLAPKTWQTWSASGQILMWKAQAIATANRSIAVAGQTPSPATQIVWKEAQHAFDIAVRLAPCLPQPYEQRAAFRTAFAFATNPGFVSSVAGLSDYEQAVALRPHDPFALALLAWLEYTDYGVHYFPGQSYDNFAVWKVLTLARKRVLLGLRRRIEHLTASPDTVLRARAYTALAWLEYEFHDVAPAQPQAHLRHALQLQPKFSEAVQLLLHTYAVEGQWSALACFCASQEQHQPDVRWPLLAAYANYKANQWTQAETKASDAAKIAPNDLAANLFLAFLLLRSDALEKWKAAEYCLDVADARMAVVDTSTEFKTAKEESAILRGFYLAMVDRPQESRKQFMRVLDEDKENADVRRALDLLPQTISPHP